MNSITLTRVLAAGLFWVLAFTPDLVFAQNQVIITPSPGNLDGNSSLRPFDTAESGRFQQVYDASLFQSLPPGGGFISEIAFRIDPVLGHPFSASIGNLQLNLSTTISGVGGLSPIFDANTGANDMAVLGPGRVGIGGLGGYDVGFFFTTPFYYDPAMGNLLLDFRIYTGTGAQPGGFAILDGFDVAGDGVSSVSAYGNSLPSMGQVSSFGLATAFVVTPVPEPSTWALIAVGVGIWAAFWKRMRKHREGRDAAD